MEVGQVEAQRDCYQFLVKTLLELQGLVQYSLAGTYALPGNGGVDF